MTKEITISFRLAPLGGREPHSDAESADVAIAGEDPARTAQWRRLLSLREDAIADGMHLMDCDEVNAEVRRRQGGATDEERRSSTVHCESSFGGSTS